MRKFLTFGVLALCLGAFASRPAPATDPPKEFILSCWFQTTDYGKQLSPSTWTQQTSGAVEFRGLPQQEYTFLFFVCHADQNGDPNGQWTSVGDVDGLAAQNGDGLTAGTPLWSVDGYWATVAPPGTPWFTTDEWMWVKVEMWQGTRYIDETITISDGVYDNRTP